MSPKPQIRVVVRMCGGTVQDIFVDSDNVEVTDIVFTEDRAHCEDKTREFFVNGGQCQGDFIYIHAGDPIVDRETVEAVIRAAEARSEVDALQGSGE